jgi:predicted Zn-dependent protease
VLRDAGRYPEAEASLRTVLKYQPDSLALAEMARVVLFQGRAPEAAGYARKAVDLDPRDPNALYLLATSLCRQEPCRSEDRAEAIDLLTKSLKLAPENEPVRRALDALRSGQPAEPKPLGAGPEPR